MRVFFDTSVLVPALVDSHPNHERVFPWLSRVIKGEVVGVISTHNLAELYSILTTIPVNRKVTTLEIYYLINKTVISNFEEIELTVSDYNHILELLSKNNIRGGTIFDALIAHAAHKAKVEKLLTFNTSHFRRVYPAIADIIEEPC